MRTSVLSALKWTAAGRFTAQFLSLTSTLVTVRILSPEDFGVFAIAMSPVTILHALAVVAPSGLIIQRQRLEAPHAASILTLQILLATAGAVILLVTVPVLSWIFADDRLFGIGFLLSTFFYVPSVVSTTLQSFFERELSFKRVSLVELASGIISMLSTLILVVSGAGIWSLGIGISVGATFQALVLVWMSRGRLYVKFGTPDLTRNDVSYGLQVGLGILMTHGFATIETFVFARGLGANGLGLGRTSLELINLPYSKLMPIINRVGFPAYARLGADLPAVRHYVDLSLRITSAVFVPVFWGMSAVSELMIPIIMGSQWSAAAPVASVVAAFLPLRLLQFCLILPHQGLGHAALVNRAMFIISATSLLGLIATVWFGLLPAALGMTIVGAVGILYSSHIALQGIGMTWRDAAQPILASVVAGAVMVATVRATTWLLSDSIGVVTSLIILVCCGALVHICVFLLLDRGKLLGRMRPLIGEMWK